MLVADPDFFRKKYFGDFGAHLSANLFATSGRADIRYLGLEVAYSHEFGRFAQFRKMVLQDNTYAVDPRQDLFSLGLTSEIIFNSETSSLDFASSLEAPSVRIISTGSITPTKTIGFTMVIQIN